MKKAGQLAINGGAPARTRRNPPMFLGGMEIDRREEEAVINVLRSRRLFRYYGPLPAKSRVEEFEKRFAPIAGTEYALGMNSCTNSLVTALLAAGVQPGDEVIVPSYTFVASAAAVVAANAIPVIVDIDESFTLDPDQVEKNVTGKTRAILPVHMRGAVCDMDAVMGIARRHGLMVVEDVAQANGSMYRGKPAGSIGNAGCYSFQFHKIITAGEGGALVTSDARLYDRARALHDCGANWRDEDSSLPEFPGYNFRMSELTGAMLLVQLERRDAIIASLRRSARAVAGAVGQFPGAALRKSNDASGDIGLCVMFTVAEQQKAVDIAAALEAEGICAATMGDPGVPDWHIYAYWNNIINRRGNNDSGFPFTLSDRVYSKDMCPRTLDLLARTVHIELNHRYTDEDAKEIATGVDKVLSCLL